MKLIGIGLIGLLVATAGCQKDDDNAATKSDLLTAKPWKLSTAGVDANSDGTIDTPLPPDTFEPCETDNLYTFKKDGSGTADEGPLKCDEADPQTADFGWTLSSDQKNITFTGSGITGVEGTVKLVTLTETKMALSQSIDLGLPIPVTVIVELTH